MGAGGFERLRSDHRRVLDETAAIEAWVTGLGLPGRLTPAAEAGLRTLLELLQRQFATHMRAEDECVFPALMAALPEARDSVRPLQAEHRELRSMLDALFERLAGAPGPERDEQVAVQVHDLADLLRIHIRKEEAVVLGVAERVLSPAEIARLDAGCADEASPHHPSRDARESSRGTHP